MVFGLSCWVWGLVSNAGIGVWIEIMWLFAWRFGVEGLAGEVIYQWEFWLKNLGLIKKTFGQVDGGRFVIN